MDYGAKVNHLPDFGLRTSKNSTRCRKTFAFFQKTLKAAAKKPERLERKLYICKLR